VWTSAAREIDVRGGTRFIFHSPHALSGCKTPFRVAAACPVVLGAASADCKMSSAALVLPQSEVHDAEEGFQKTRDDVFVTSSAHV
jgi:hypothetical protein